MKAVSIFNCGVTLPTFMVVAVAGLVVGVLVMPLGLAISTWKIYKGWTK